MTFDTLSESLFAAICVREGYTPEKIPTERGKTADFRILTPFGQLIAEVKELKPNTEERAALKELSEGKIVGFGGTIGSRASKQLKEASKQLKPYSKERIPCLVVLYSNIGDCCPHLHIEPFDIDVAMHGEWVTWSRRHPSPTPLPPDFNGKNRSLRIDSRTYVSAVAVISNLNRERFYLYHNAFADNPLPPELFTHKECFHYRKPVGPHLNPSQWDCFDPLRME